MEEKHDLMTDMFRDLKHQRLMMFKVSFTIIFTLLAIIAGLVAGMIKISLDSQKQIKDLAEKHNKQMMEIMTESELTTEYTIETDNQSLNNGFIVVNKN